MQQPSGDLSEEEPSLNPESRIPDPDHSFLLHALRLAERGLGRTWPNPSVGCVIVKEGRIVGLGRTADGGRPHAETVALAMAGEDARGASVYVSLEPCAHHGKTPPCTQALIDAGVARVVIGCEDPDPRVQGKGAAMLRSAGVEVKEITNQESRIMNRGFFRRVQHGLPYVSLKLATSSDFFMARGDGGGQWITGEAARAHGQRLRGMHDAMLTGIGTVLMDDPMLNVRPPLCPHPNLVRVVADRQLRLPLSSKLVRSANVHPLWVITTAEAVEKAASHATELREAGVSLMVVENQDLPPALMLKLLAEAGITRVMVEAGPALSSAFLRDGQVHTLHWYQAPMMLGSTGKSRMDALDSKQQIIRPESAAEALKLGEDTYTRYELA